MKRAHPSKKVWCSGLGLCFQMSPVFDFSQGLRCGLSIRHCHSVTESWQLELFSCNSSSFLCAGTLSPRGKCCYFFARGLVAVDKHLFQMVSLVVTSMTLPQWLNHIFVLLLANVDVIPKQKWLKLILSKTRRKIYSMSSMKKLKGKMVCMFHN